jgi:hypothetical protein
MCDSLEQALAELKIPPDVAEVLCQPGNKQDI